MSILYFLAASGAIAWGFVLWRGYQSMRHGLQRLRWALWGYRRPSRRAS